MHTPHVRKRAEFKRKNWQECSINPRADHKFVQRVIALNVLMNRRNFSGEALVNGSGSIATEKANGWSILVFPFNGSMDLMKVWDEGKQQTAGKMRVWQGWEGEEKPNKIYLFTISFQP